MKKLLFCLLGCGLLLSACKKEETQNDPFLDEELAFMLTASAPTGTPAYFQLPASTDLAAIPQDPNNPLTSQKIELGRLLYHETAMAIHPERPEGTGTYSCASCHFAEAGFQAGRFQGIGEGGLGVGANGLNRNANENYFEAELDVQPLRSPAALNIAYQTNVLWNGQFGATGVNIGTEAVWPPDTPIEVNFLGYEGVETQAIAGLTVHRMGINDTLLDLGYRALFDAAFPDFEATDRYTLETAGLAIAAYERTLLANQAPFQHYLKGDLGALSPAEKRGAILFFGKAACTSCHTGPALNTMEFHALGFGDLFECGSEVFKTPETDAAHLGRGSFTKQAVDDYKFKVPQLYNLADSPFYGHGATFTSIEAVVDYKNKAIAANSHVPADQLADLFKPLFLSEDEVRDLAAFLEFGLRDESLIRYVPSQLLSGNCFPFNDPISQVELDCN